MSKVEDLKLNNEQMIRECFYDGEVWTKNELSLKKDISLAATTNILFNLQKHKEIIYKGEAESTGGRKSKQYQLNKDYYHILKVTLKRGEVHQLMIFRSVNLFNQLLDEVIIQTKEGTVDELLAGIKQMINKDHRITIICLSVPGICQNGFIDICDFKQLINKDLKKLIMQQYPIEIVIENDVNVACIGFSYSFQECQHLAFIYQPKLDYVGCGIMIGRKLYNGFSHFAGELRYSPIFTHQQQDILLKENPKELLEKQVETLCSIINPEIVGIHSDAIEDLNTLTLNGIPSIHQPKLEYIKDFDEMMMTGLYQIALKKLKEKRGMK